MLTLLCKVYMKRLETSCDGIFRIPFSFHYLSSSMSSLVCGQVSNLDLPPYSSTCSNYSCLLSAVIVNWMI